MKAKSKSPFRELAFLVCLCVVYTMLTSCADLSKTGKAYRVDVTPQMSLQAAKLSGKTPKPRWQTLAPLSEIEEILPGVEGTTLVGYLEMDTRYANSPSLVPFYGPYVLYDLKTGRELWRHARERNPGLAYNVLLTDPYLVYASKGDNATRIAVVDPGSGKLMWETSIDSVSVAVSINPSRRVVIVHSMRPASRISVLELTSGKRLWSTGLTSEEALFEFDGDRMLVVSGDLAQYSLRDGRRLWQLKDPAAKSRPMNLVADDAGYLIARRNGSVSRVSTAGKLAWRTSLPGVPELATLGNGLAIVAVRSDAKQDMSLQALSLRTGKRVWRQRISGGLSSALQPVGNRLVYTTAGAIEAVSTRNGKRLFSAPLTEREPGRLADHIGVFPGHIAVASESVVSGHAPDSGRELWRVELNGTDYLTRAVARSQVKGSVDTDPENALAGVVGGYANNLNAMYDSSDFYIKQARQNYTNVYNDTRRAILSGSSTEKADAYFQRSLAASNVRNTQMINRAYETTMLSVNTAFNALANAQAVEKNARVGAAAAEEDRAIKRLLLSSRIHESGLQGDYYLRPFRSRRGNGVVLVNMRLGTWAEIPSGPSETILEDKIYMNILLGLVTDRASLVTIGTGLDTAKWQTDQRFQTGGLQKTMFAFTLEDRNRTTMIRRSLLCYDLAEATFRPASEYDLNSLTRQKSRIVR
jgi:hypothetical protein